MCRMVDMLTNDDGVLMAKRTYDFVWLCMIVDYGHIKVGAVAYNVACVDILWYVDVPHHTLAVGRGLWGE